MSNFKSDLIDFQVCSIHVHYSKHLRQQSFCCAPCKLKSKLGSKVSGMFLERATFQASKQSFCYFTMCTSVILFETVKVMIVIDFIHLCFFFFWGGGDSPLSYVKDNVLLIFALVTSALSSKMIQLNLTTIWKDLFPIYL